MPGACRLFCREFAGVAGRNDSAAGQGRCLFVTFKCPGLVTACTAEKITELQWSRGVFDRVHKTARRFQRAA